MFEFVTVLIGWVSRVVRDKCIYIREFRGKEIEGEGQGRGLGVAWHPLPSPAIYCKSIVIYYYYLNSFICVSPA